jgi:dihydroorotase-like cyclic amidohydrolase
MHTAAGWTPYEGMEVTGTVDMTILRGKVIFQKGKITGEKGMAALSGRF